MDKYLAEGYVGTEPRLNTPNGRKVASFKVALNRDYRPQGQLNYVKRDPEWLEVSVWGDRAQTITDRVKKGCLVSIEGRATARTYIAKDGKAVPVLCCIARSVRVLKPSKSDAVKEAERLLNHKP